MNILENVRLGTEVTLLGLTQKYQLNVIKNKGTPNTSEKFRQALVKNGLGGALQSYLYTCVYSGKEHAKSVIRKSKGRNIPSSLDKIMDLSFALLYATVIGPVQTFATLNGLSIFATTQDSAIGWDLFSPPEKDPENNWQWLPGTIIYPWRWPEIPKYEGVDKTIYQNIS